MENSEKLIDKLEISKDELYQKYRKYKTWKDLNDPAYVISIIFDIDKNNKHAIFLICTGLNAIENEMNNILRRN